MFSSPSSLQWVISLMFNGFDPKYFHLRANKELKVIYGKGLRVVVRAGRCLQNGNQMPFSECLFQMCCTHLNGFIYSQLFVSTSVSVFKYLALSTGKFQPINLYMLIPGKCDSSVSTMIWNSPPGRQWKSCLCGSLGGGKFLVEW